MGNSCDSLLQKELNVDLKRQLSKSTTGSLINLTPQHKQLFIQQIKKTLLDKDKVHQFQPLQVNNQSGFLYKVGIFFYEGVIAKNSSMEGKGRLTLIQKRMEYQGQFKNNQFNKNGVLTTPFQNKIKGNWEEGQPKELSFTQHGKQYKLTINHTSEDKNNIRGILCYPDGRKYQGEFTYDQASQQYLVTGQGKLQYPSGDTLSGRFHDGNLNGQGRFISRTKGEFSGSFLNGKFHGTGRFVYTDKKILDIQWINNKPHGQGTFNINGESITVHYQHGSRITHLCSRQLT